MRRLNLPEPKSYSDPNNPQSGPWGLAELIIERVLASPENFASTELCSRIMGLITKFQGLRGTNQVGRSVLLTDEEHEFLVRGVSVGIERFARQVGGILPTHLVFDIAVYCRALYTAEVVKEDSVPSLSQGGLA